MDKAVCWKSEDRCKTISLIIAAGKSDIVDLEVKQIDSSSVYSEQREEEVRQERAALS